MSIQSFDTLALANAVPNPKLIWHDVNRYVVYTGADIPVKSQEQLDKEAAKGYAKLNALAAMTPAQIQTWVDANVTNLAQAQDAIKTLAIAVSILARQL